MFKNDYKEIGWFPVFTLKQAKSNVSLLENIPEKFSAFHWHGDTFNLPEDTKRLFLSEACENQGFIYSDRVIGLRFHLEMSNETIGNVIENCNDELIDGKYIQNEKEMVNKDSLLSDSRLLMFNLLDNLERLIGS